MDWPVNTLLAQTSKLWYSSICMKSQNRQNLACLWEKHTEHICRQKSKTQEGDSPGSQGSGGGARGVKDGVQFRRAANVASQLLTSRFLYLKSRYMGAYNYSWNCNMFFVIMYSQLFKKQSAHPLITTAPQKRKASFLHVLLTRWFIFWSKAGESKNTSDYFSVFSLRIFPPQNSIYSAFSLRS